MLHVVPSQCTRFKIICCSHNIITKINICTEDNTQSDYYNWTPHTRTESGTPIAVEGHRTFYSLCCRVLYQMEMSIESFFEEVKFQNNTHDSIKSFVFVKYLQVFLLFRLFCQNVALMSGKPELLTLHAERICGCSKGHIMGIILCLVILTCYDYAAKIVCFPHVCNFSFCWKRRVTGGLSNWPFSMGGTRSSKISKSNLLW